MVSSKSPYGVFRGAVSVPLAVDKHSHWICLSLGGIFISMVVKSNSLSVEHLGKELRLDSGMIPLQSHDSGMIVHFKDIRLTILK